jgi:hypothetical protein
MKRTRDGRIIEKRVVIDKELLRKLLLEIKIKKSSNWIMVAKKFGVSTQTLRHEWLKKDATIPLTVFKRILSILQKDNDKNLLDKVKILEPFWGQKIEGGRDKSKKINIPDRSSEELAEFYGILLGDGCLFSDLKGLSITADKILEYDYFTKYLNNLLYHLFGLHPKFYFDRNTRTIRCVLYSKNAVKYLSELGFPIGFKKNLIIPKFIYKNKKNLLRCLRGLMDTDGSLSAHPHSKIMIHLSITSDSLRKDVAQALIDFEIKPGLFNKGIMLYGKNAIKFCDIVGFSNLKNILKYKNFNEVGRVPKTKEVESFIRLEEPN